MRSSLAAPDENRAPHDGAAGAVGYPTSDSGSPWLSTPQSTPLPPGPAPDAIGPYRILDLLGEGGMGVVYRAQQTEPLRREVAIKIVKRGSDSDRVVARFERERRVLARLDHPHVARVIDAGATADGRPYFVMELVQGRRVTAYCDAERLDIDARLALFLDICAGVRHAHQRGVLHRDLKPSNVLVARVDGRPVAKVIDFGIAKVMDDTDDQPALDTRLNGQAIGTPAYMSPEQAGRVDAGIDTRTDVYSLGVLLYELLTGHHPRDFAPHAAEGSTTERRPSDAVLRPLTHARAPVVAEAVAAARQSTPQRLRRRLSGDLDTVVLKAIEFDPERRYESVEQFADDVRRAIVGEPVRAKPPTFAYRTRRFVLRHRVAVSAATLAVVLLSATAGVLARQRTVIAQERDRARAAERRAALDADAAREVTTFMVDLFEVASPIRGGASPVTARQMLDEGAARVRTELAGTPPLRARLLTAMGGAYMGLSEYDAAEAALKDALALWRAPGMPADMNLFETLQHLSRIRTQRGDLDGARAYLRQAGDALAQIEPQPGKLRADFLNNRGLVESYAGEYATARKTLEEALGLTLRQPATDAERKDGRVRYNLAGVIYELGDLKEAEAQFAAAEKAFRRAGPASRDLPANLVAAQSARGLVLRDLRRLDEARPVLEAGVAEARRVFREPHPALATIINNLALVEQDQKDYAGAETHFREVLQIDRAVSGARHADVASDLHNLAWFLHKYRGRSAEAEDLSRQAVAMRREVLGPKHPQTASTVRQLADILAGRGRPAEAVPLYREALAIQTDTLPKGHRLTLIAALGLGEALTALGERADAIATLQAALATAASDSPARTDLEAALTAARSAVRSRRAH